MFKIQDVWKMDAVHTSPNGPNSAGYFPHLHLITKADPASEISYSLSMHKKMDNVEQYNFIMRSFAGSTVGKLNTLFKVIQL
jgi:hypothetical protein